MKDARQYTIPVDAALASVRNGENPQLTTRQKHTRDCYVVLEEGADASAVEETIKTMPNYFSDYDTTVHFVSEEELQKKPQQTSARRICTAQRLYRMGTGEQSSDRIQPETGFKSRVYRLCDCRICKEPPTGLQRKDRLAVRQCLTLHLHI